MRQVVRIAGVVSCLCLLVGCSGKGPPRAAVSGSVTLDGESVTNGVIVFIPTDDTKGPSVGGVITDGRYEIPAKKGVVIGKNRVEIRWGKPTGKQIKDRLSPGTSFPEMKEAVPPQYNVDSELVREVKAGTNAGGQFDFNLQSKAK